MLMLSVYTESVFLLGNTEKPRGLLKLNRKTFKRGDVLVLCSLPNSMKPSFLEKKKVKEKQRKKKQLIALDFSKSLYSCIITQILLDILIRYSY